MWHLHKELPPEENLYLCCLTNKLQDTKLANQLADDYKQHQNQDIYTKYMHQITTANTKEIIERTKKEDAEYYLPKIDQLSSQIDDLSSQNTYLKSLPTKNGIPFQV